jgi:glyceraldehyde-3-phosphate dehydrogenase (NADP+)
MNNIRPFYLAGAFKRGDKTLKVNNPYNGEVVEEVSLASEEDIDLAIERAVSAFRTTRVMPSYQRANVLTQIAAQINSRSEEFAKTMTLENGKPIQHSRKEVGRAAATFSWAAEEAKRVGGELLSLDLLKGAEWRIGFYRRFPMGPITAITPFNFPLNLIAHKMAPAIAAGNPVLIKPAPQTPITALLLAEIIAQSSLIPGAVSVLPCEIPVAQKLITDDRIRMLTFTGSAKVGWQLRQQAGKKKVGLELGGNAGVIVHQDASLE